MRAVCEQFFLQIPGGWLCIRFGGKLVFGLGVLAPAIVTALTPFTVKSYGMFILARIITGLGESVTYPSVHAMLGKWSPQIERTRMVGWIWSGAYMGIVTPQPCLRLSVRPLVHTHMLRLAGHRHHGGVSSVWDHRALPSVVGWMEGRVLLFWCTRGPMVVHVDPHSGLHAAAAQHHHRAGARLHFAHGGQNGAQAGAMERPPQQARRLEFGHCPCHPQLGIL